MNDGIEFEEQEITINEICNVCGERNFNLREGFYYCNECGTKHDQILALHVNKIEDFTEVSHVRKTKIQKEKCEPANLTSWECYNYILRALVEELLSLGAKEDLKLMTLQLWAAYLRKVQVAFFNKKYADLPKLGMKFKRRDAQTLYNYRRKKSSLRGSRKSDGSIVTSEATSKRSYRKSKRKLDESVYSQYSSITNMSTSLTGISSSISALSTRTVQLKFSTIARKHFKKVMNPKHLKKHEDDVEGTLKCHSLNVTTAEMHRADYKFTTLNMKQLYAILGIALNLVEDSIQISDLLRFIAEGHIFNKNALKYLPENVANEGANILKDIGLNSNSDSYSDKVLRDQMSLFSKSIGLRAFKKPNMLSLIQRYVTELNLPQEIYSFSERLYNLLPPSMKGRAPHVFPNYEARAMAYIVFALKLFFGLDSYKEVAISNSSKIINERLEYANSHLPQNSKYQSLFVWTDWVKFIEMRKIIISQHSRTFCKQYKQNQSTDIYIAELLREQTVQFAEEEVMNDGVKKEKNSKISNMQNFFESLFSKFENIRNEKSPEITFKANLTPTNTKFKTILLHYKTNGENSLQIPDFMKVDHTQRTLFPHLDPQYLYEHLRKADIHMNLKILPCAPSRNYIGVFWNVEEYIPRRVRAFLADFNVNEDEWSKEIILKPVTDNLLFKTELESYRPQYLKEQKKKQDKLIKLCSGMKRRDAKICDFNHPKRDSYGNETNIIEDNKMAMIDVLKEHNMEAKEKFETHAPGPSIKRTDILSESANNKLGEEHFGCLYYDRKMIEETPNSVTLVTSKMDYWLLLGTTAKIFENQKKDLQQKMPPHFLWLLETCAQTIGVDWFVIYEQLLTIEVMFGHGISNLDEFTECLHFKYNYPIKDLNILINSFRDIW